MVERRGEFEAILRVAPAKHAALRARQAAMGQSIAQLQAERNEALDRLNLLDMQVTALRSNNADLSAALEAEQGRGGELASVIAARDRVRDCDSFHRQCAATAVAAVAAGCDLTGAWRGVPASAARTTGAGRGLSLIPICRRRPIERGRTCVSSDPVQQ